MARRPSLGKVKSDAISFLNRSLERYEKARTSEINYLLLRWIASMIAVEVYAVWERYTEKRLALALTHHPEAFFEEFNVRGLKTLSVGLASVLVRGGSRYFDFRSSSDLIAKGDTLVGKDNNPFRAVPKETRDYLDTLAVIRNYVVHNSNAALAAYKRNLSAVYSVKAKPQPDEFLNSIDYRRNSPLRYQPRIKGLIEVVKSAVNHS
jgi:hypothetical protein